MLRLALTWAILLSLPTMAFAEPQVLEKFVGKDLKEVAPAELAPLRKLLRNPKNVEPKAAPQAGSGADYSELLDLFGPSPSYVWTTTNPTPKRFIVFEEDQLTFTPGASGAYLHLFDQTGKKLRYWELSVGWRMSLDKASFSYSKELEAYLMTIHTSPDNWGVDVARQYFTLSEDSLLCVRLEDSKGKLVSNDYEHPHSTHGLMPTAKTRDQWIRLLQSRNKRDVLAALMFIGGQHLDPPRKEPDHLLEEIEQATLAEAIRGDKDIAKLIRQHQQSDSQWIKEAASLAAEKLRSR